MEISLTKAEGVPDGSLVSIKAGSTRRQGVLKIGQPFRFPARKVAGPLEVDILAPIGKANIQLNASSSSYTTPVDMLGRQTGVLEFEARYTVQQGQKEPNTVIALSNTPAIDAGGRTLSAAELGRAYIEEHGLLKIVQDALQNVIQEKPGDPVEFICKLLRKGESSRSVVQVDNSSHAGAKQEVQRNTNRILTDTTLEFMPDTEETGNSWKADDLTCPDVDPVLGYCFKADANQEILHNTDAGASSQQPGGEFAEPHVSGLFNTPVAQSEGSVVKEVNRPEENCTNAKIEAIAATPVVPGWMGTFELETEGKYEAKDIEGRWWPITLTKKNDDGTYSATVDNNVKTKWTSVHAGNVRLKQTQQFSPVPPPKDNTKPNQTNEANKEPDLDLESPGKYEARDVEGTWHPITLKRKNDDGTYSATVNNKQETRWPVVHAANVRLAPCSEEAEAALRIQSIHRGNQARKTVAKGKEVANSKEVTKKEAVVLSHEGQRLAENQPEQKAVQSFAVAKDKDAQNITGEASKEPEQKAVQSFAVAKETDAQNITGEASKEAEAKVKIQSCTGGQQESLLKEKESKGFQEELTDQWLDKPANTSEATITSPVGQGTSSQQQQKQSHSPPCLTMHQWMTELSARIETQVETAKFITVTETPHPDPGGICDQFFDPPGVSLSKSRVVHQEVQESPQPFPATDNVVESPSSRKVVVTAETRRLPEETSRYVGSVGSLVVGENLYVPPARKGTRKVVEHNVDVKVTVAAENRVTPGTAQPAVKMNENVVSLSSGPDVGLYVDPQNGVGLYVDSQYPGSPQAVGSVDRTDAILKNTAPTVDQNVASSQVSPQHAIIENKPVLTPTTLPSNNEKQVQAIIAGRISYSSDCQEILQTTPHSSNERVPENFPTMVNRKVNQKLGEVQTAESEAGSAHVRAQTEPRPPPDPKTLSGVSNRGSFQTTNDPMWAELTKTIDEGTFALQDMAAKLKAENERLRAAS